MSKTTNLGDGWELIEDGTYTPFLHKRVDVYAQAEDLEDFDFVESGVVEQVSVWIPAAVRARFREAVVAYREAEARALTEEELHGTWEALDTAARAYLLLVAANPLSVRNIKCSDYDLVEKVFDRLPGSLTYVWRITPCGARVAAYGRDRP